MRVQAEDDVLFLHVHEGSKQPIPNTEDVAEIAVSRGHLKMMVGMV